MLDHNYAYNKKIGNQFIMCEEIGGVKQAQGKEIKVEGDNGSGQLNPHSIEVNVTLAQVNEMSNHEHP